MRIFFKNSECNLNFEDKYISLYIFFCNIDVKKMHFFFFISG